MDHIKILKRAFEIVRSYRVLWIFGFLLALTTSRGSGSNSGYQFGNGDFDGRNPFPPDSRWPGFPWETFNDVLGIIIAVACVIFLLGVAFTIVRYVSETAAIRLVDRYEAGGEKVSFREGWRTGWSRAAFRMWLVDLIFGLGTFILILLIFALAAAPLLLWLTESRTAGIIGTVATVGLGILAILVVIVIASALTILAQFFHRAVALENLGVMDSIRRGWAVVRRRVWDAVLMGLILFGVGLLFTIVMIPIFLLVGFTGVVAGGIPALLAGAITNIFAHGSTPQIVAMVVGVPIFLVVLVIPLTFIGGLFEMFNNSAWTLAYREMVALETTQPPAPLAQPPLGEAQA